MMAFGEALPRIREGVEQDLGKHGLMREKVLASLALQEFEAFGSAPQAKKNVTQAIKAVAHQLGNTPAICRKCYVHPGVLDMYLDGTMLQALEQRAEQELVDSLHSRRPEEAAVMALLSRRLSQQASPEAS